MKEFPERNSLTRQMLLERLQQLVVSKKNIWGSCYRLFVSLGWSCNTALSSGINLKIQVTASGDHICFVFIINVNQKKKEKVKIRITKWTSTKVHRRNCYSNQVFFLWSEKISKSKSLKIKKLKLSRGAFIF